MADAPSDNLSFDDLYKKADYLMSKIESSKNPPLTALNILNSYMAQIHAKCEKNNGLHVNAIEKLQDRIDRFYKDFRKS
jgi:hypothetical protein